MNTLKIPEAGLRLSGPDGSESSIPAQAFPITLSSSVIEGMVQCVKNKGKIELALGSNPTFFYGSSSHQLSPTNDSFPYDLYLTQPFESTRSATKLPNSSSLFSKPRKTHHDTTDNSKGSQSKQSTSSKSSASSGLDSDIEALQNGFAAHNAARERAHVVEGLAPSKKAAAKAKGKLLPGSLGSQARSMSTSPSLNPVGSPSSTPLMSASQQAMERAKEQRFTLVHELAVKDQPKSRLEDKWEGSESDLERTLSKVAEYNDDSKTWALKRVYWKELDVWKYDYRTQDERQKAIDNAIKQYDKQRLSSSEPEWQKLLPMEERGQGKCLSRLQANLARGPAAAAPKIQLQKADDSSTSKDDGDSLDSEKGAIGGVSMARSGSNSSISKLKKPAGQEAQTKRLLGKAKPKPVPQKPSPSKARGTKANGGRVLSQAIIENSDSSGDDAPPPPPPKPKQEPKPQRPSKDTVVVNTRVVEKETAKAKQQIASRRQEEADDLDDSSSSSGTPLARRLTQKPLRLAKPLNNRASDANHHSRVSSVSTNSKPKNPNTSPTKSSPLAASPPTNASDMEQEMRSASSSKKRKAEDEPRVPSKRQAVRSVPSDVLRQAQLFKMYYRKYEALHWEISGLENPPDNKLDELLQLRDRLAGMKRRIYKQYGSA